MSAVIDAYLKQFGYDQSVKGIQKAQEILGLEPTGLDSDLNIAKFEKRIITTPRCGHVDVAKARGDSSINQWLKDKVLNPKNGLKYAIQRYVDGISRQDQKDIIADSFAAWQKHTQLAVYMVDDPSDADIVIDASANRREEFGTAGNVLAWAHLPQGSRWTGKLLMKYDLAETWLTGTVSPNARGVYMRNVTAHEIGHLLGIEHTDIKGQLMFPIYTWNIYDPQPGYDVDQAQLRYEKATIQVPGPPVKPGATPPQDNLLKDMIVTYKGNVYRLVPV